MQLLTKYFKYSFQILYKINSNFMDELKKRIGLDYNRLSRMSIVEEGAVQVFLEQSVLLNLVTFSRLYCHFACSRNFIR